MSPGVNSDAPFVLALPVVLDRASFILSPGENSDAPRAEPRFSGVVVLFICVPGAEPEAPDLGPAANADDPASSAAAAIIESFFIT